MLSRRMQERERATSRGRRRRTGRRCVVTGCARLVQPGKALCREHGRGEQGRDYDAAVRRLGKLVAGSAAGAGEASGSAGEREERTAAAFRRRLERGEYRGLFDARLREVMAQAATERGLADELGALRVVLARLLAEEEDVGKLAVGVARVARASAIVARAQWAVGGNAADELTEALMQALTALDSDARGIERELG